VVDALKEAIGLRLALKPVGGDPARLLIPGTLYLRRYKGYCHRRFLRVCDSKSGSGSPDFSLKQFAAVRIQISRYC
jgi:hypothetical protein